MMRHSQLRRLLFLALCCDLGFFAKQIIAPAANLLTDALHIPGGISTAFSLMFLVIAAEMVPHFGCAAIMGLIQSLLALALGRMGSMGILSPIGYIIPGLAVDIALLLLRRLSVNDRLVIANMLAGITAALTANLIVFRLPAAPLVLYLGVAATSGALCGLLAARIIPLVRRAVSFERQKGKSPT